MTTQPIQPMSDKELVDFDRRFEGHYVQGLVATYDIYPFEIIAMRERLRVAEAKGRELDRILSATTIEGDGIPYWVERLEKAEAELQAATAVCVAAQRMWRCGYGAKNRDNLNTAIIKWLATRGDK